MANPNPNPETRFKPGQSGNPKGRSSQELENLNKAARIASELKLKALSCLQEYVDTKEGASEILGALMNADALRLFKEVEDRAYGTPKQTLSNDPDAPFTPTIDMSKLSADALRELLDATNPESK